MHNAKEIKESLIEIGNEEKAKNLRWFFKTGKGQYGEGDLFLGITVPENRMIAKHYMDTPLEELELLIADPYHEVRFCALLILVEQFKKQKAQREQIVEFYLSHTQYINNWDLVDLSCPAILGNYLLDKERSLLDRLIHSNLLWEQRIAIVTNWTLIRKGELDDIFRLAEVVLNHPHDLMQKATGWMLREAGKKDKERLCHFLGKYHTTMPRTTLRYAIEKLDAGERAYYMQKTKKEA
ncbi:MAG: DNA alkylation repair protein [Bacteroidales bacterium]|nr:DNA alkylation repair protein [Bacteroidales bacterium]